MKVYYCEDSIEGIFTAIYNIYEDKNNFEDTEVSLVKEPKLFAEFIEVETDPEKAMKVIRTICKQFGQDNYLELCYAMASYEEGKAQAVYKTIREGIKNHLGYGQLLDALANDYVNQVFKFARNVAREDDHIKGFLRFEELQGNLLFSRIGPKNHILPFLMSHFADRFPNENFMIYDENRRIFGVHPAFGQWYMVENVSRQDLNLPEKTEQEVFYGELFCHFCKKIAIKQRENRQLQRNMLPLRYREYMVEFDQNAQK